MSRETPYDDHATVRTYSDREIVEHGAGGFYVVMTDSRAAYVIRPGSAYSPIFATLAQAERWNA